MRSVVIIEVGSEFTVKQSLQFLAIGLDERIGILDGFSYADDVKLTL